MIFVAHRINTVRELSQVPQHFGVEVDLRDKNERLILQHEPFKDGEDFETFLQSYAHALLILNIKSERIEFKVIELLKKYNINEYFFLDSSFPMIYTLGQRGEKNIAVRFSEFEGIDTILAAKNRIKWVWVDCFSKLPIDKITFKKLKAAGLKLCLTSPDLVGRDIEIDSYFNFLNQEGIIFDAICTKQFNVSRWSSKLCLQKESLML
jgi:hypothetical protein